MRFARASRDGRGGQGAEARRRGAGCARRVPAVVNRTRELSGKTRGVRPRVGSEDTPRGRCNIGVGRPPHLPRASDDLPLHQQQRLVKPAARVGGRASRCRSLRCGGARAHLGRGGRGGAVRDSPRGAAAVRRRCGAGAAHRVQPRLERSEFSLDRRARGRVGERDVGVKERRRGGRCGRRGGRRGGVEEPRGGDVYSRRPPRP